MEKIFIIEDNENVREAAAGYLKLEGFLVEEFGELASAGRAITTGSPDLLVLDVMLPDGDGFMFAKRLRRESDVPIIFLTARDQESDRITGLEIGADDYMIKPFSARELVLRVKAVLRRTSAAGEEQTDIQTYRLDEDKLEVSESRHTAILNGRSLSLTAAEWNLLIFLSQKSPQVFSRIQLLEYCLDSIAEGSERTVDTHIKNIRHKIGSEWIETVRGFGYRFSGNLL